ncbi:hypothetical protein [Plantibacter sp. YIM 135249]|uniref:hypothetical protein n=1 Tax=Plantibacter sp. YIM 135249 TaxID=3423918 RepID=UPI003D3596EA
MLRFFVTDFATGRVLETLPVESGSWSDPLNAAESMSASFDTDDPDTRALDLWNLTTRGKHALGVAEGEVVLAYGPIWSAKYSRDSGTFDIDALGVASYFDHRNIIPVVAKTIGVDKFVIPDPTDASKTVANPAVGTYLKNLSYGTIAKRWLQQAMAWTGGAIPLVFQADEVGVFERNFEGADFKGIWEAINQLQNVEEGVETNFKTRFINNGLFVETLFETGTLAQPLITSTSKHRWDVTGEESPVTKFERVDDATNLGSVAWNTGGRSQEKVLVARAVSDELVNAGYPLMELVDSAHTSVSEQSTLDTQSVRSLQVGSRPRETWSFDVRTDVEPLVGTYTTGDFCELAFAAGADPIVPGGDYQHRIVGLSGDLGSDTIRVYCAPKMGT